MKPTSSILLATGALAQLASAVPDLQPRDYVTVTEIAHTTVIDYVTEGAPAASSSATTRGAAALKSAHSALHHKWHTHKGTPVAATSSGSADSSSPASDSSTLAASSVTSVVAVDPSSYTLSSYGGLPSSAAASSSSVIAVLSPSGYGGASSAVGSAAATSTSSGAGPSAYSSTAVSSSTGPSAYSSAAAPSSSGLSGYGSATSAAPQPTFSTGLKGYTGRKAGLSGYVGCQEKAAFQQLANYIGWYSDYTPTTQDAQGVQGIPMLWGDSSSCSSDNSDGPSRWEDFTSNVTDYTPPIMFGFYEPDCPCPMSSDINDASYGLNLWNEHLKPLGAKGTTLGSPSMCKQKDETWLQEFSGLSTDQELATWDVTSIHINKNTTEGAIEDIEYYVGKYGKPVWVSEFACVDDHIDFTPCTNQTTIDNFIYGAVDYFQKNESVVAYGASNGEGLGYVWPLISNTTGKLTATGQTYLNAIMAAEA